MINQIGEYVHHHLAEPISLELLAKEVGISKYHLNRLFFAATGLKLGEFIQRRRMEHAYHLLAAENTSVIDVALCVGYESHAAFSRAFRKVFNVEPGKVKRGVTPKFVLPKLKINSEKIKLAPEIIDLPEQKIVGLYGNGFENQSFFKLAQQLYEQVAQSLSLADGFDFNSQKLIGVSIDSPWRGEQAQSRFFAGVITDISDMNSQPKLLEYLWPKGRWARFEHKGPYNTMWQTILSIYANWVIPNNYELNDCSIVQHYVNDANTTPSDELLTHLYIPLTS